MSTHFWPELDAFVRLSENMRIYRAFDDFDTKIDKVAFPVTLQGGESGGGSLCWTKRGSGKDVVYTSEPYVGLWSRFVASFLRLLPIDSIL